MTHYIYLVRHGEHQDAEHGVDDGPLSPRGQRQAELIAEWGPTTLFLNGNPAPDAEARARLAARKVAIDYRPVHTYTMSNDIAYIEPKARVY